MVSRSLDTTSHVLSSFPAYVVEDEIPRTKTPEPIKVKRTKKKGVSFKVKTDSRRMTSERS